MSGEDVQDPPAAEEAPPAGGEGEDAKADAPAEPPAAE